MHKFILFIKSYQGDIIVFKNLIESIKKFNRDSIPVYVSVNDSDYDLFKDNVDSSIHLIKDSEIEKVEIENPWEYQQVIKSQVHQLKICENYLCIDSDSEFIRDFYLSDFMFDENTPYTILHQEKELLSWVSINTKKLGFDPKEEFENHRSKIMNALDRKGAFYSYGPTPVICSCSVWESFEKNYLQKNNLTFNQIIKKVPGEFIWYGEWLLKDQTIPIYPIEPLFKVFHYEKQYDDYLKCGHTIASIKQNYLGIGLQSNWNSKKKKNWFQKLLK